METKGRKQERVLLWLWKPWYWPTYDLYQVKLYIVSISNSSKFFTKLFLDITLNNRYSPVIYLIYEYGTL